MKKIFIVEDEIVVAKDLEYTLAANGFHVIDIATGYDLALKKLLTVEPDIILCDINLRGQLTGIDLMAEVQKKYAVPFIFITAYSDMETLQKANKLNPVNYITKPFNEKQLISSINLAFIGEARKEPPTPRELSVINLLAKGHSSKEIAEELSISFNTVETHRKNLMKKYHVKTSAELICLAASKGWVKFQEHCKP